MHSDLLLLLEAMARLAHGRPGATVEYARMAEQLGWEEGHVQTAMRDLAALHYVENVARESAAITPDGVDAASRRST